MPDVSPETVETNVLSAIKTTEDLGKILQAQVTSKYFVLYPNAFQYIVEHVRAYGAIPAKEVIESKEEDLQLIEHNNGLSSWTEELIKMHMCRGILDAIDNHLAEGKLEEDPIPNARALAMDLNSLLKTLSLNISRIDKDGENRLAEFLERRRIVAEGGLLGMRTGLRVFDEHQEGWLPGECIMVMGPKGIGKSWNMMNFAVNAYVAGHKVLFLSPEMSWEECSLRFDVICMYLWDIDIGGGHRELKEGNPHIKVKEYEKYLKRVAERDDFIVVDSDKSGGFNLGNITALIEEHQPDLVVFDGIHLVREERGDHWMQIKLCADGLKALAQLRKIVVIWSCQVEKAAMRDPYEPADTGSSVGYGKASVEAANRLITLAIDRHDRLYRWFKVINSRDGREWINKQKLLFDVNHGHIEQVVISEDDTSEF